ncbi:MAG: threonine synthase [Duodenibacillus sp.]|nr:threonine synthase [Duodenibacillus sp.]
MQYVCTRCGKRADAATMAPACECGGLFELDFTPPAWDPARIRRDTWSIFRYRDFMAVDGDVWRSVSMGEGMTPVVQFKPGVLFKQDYYMPTLSFKDRGAATLVSHMKAIGVKSCVQDSSGNAGNSVAAYCARAGIACDIYVPEGTSPKKIDMIRAHGATAHVVPGTRDHCADVCRARVRDDGAYYANHVYNPYFYEGMKAYVYETLEQLGRLPEVIVIPTGNGTLYIGVVKALEHLHASGAIAEFPRIVALQSELCDPLLQGWKAGSPEPAKITPRPTIAEGIAIGVPMRGAELLGMAARRNITFVHAPEDKILEARAEIARGGVYCEHTTAANYAAWLAYKEMTGDDAEALIPMCGAGLKSDH